MKDLLNSILDNSGLESNLIDEIKSVGRFRKAKAGESVITPENIGSEMPMVLSGLLKVMRGDQTGNEVFLYYLEGGEACAMSIACCLENKYAAFHLVAEEDCVLWMVPLASLDSWLVKYLSFRKFVFSSYQQRFDELLESVESVVFDKMDQRLYKYLLDTQEATGSFRISKTHQQIARDLNTSRVVISRLLKQLEKEEKIEQRRNLIELL